MENLKFSCQINMWGLTQTPKISDWNEWSEYEFSNAVYYKDWDKIFKYYAGVGIKGIELMFYMRPYILQEFGSAENFADFARERGVEVTGAFSIAYGTDKESHKAIIESNDATIDFLARCGAKYIVIMPAGQYFGQGPLSEEGLKNNAAVMNEIGKRSAEKGILTTYHIEFWCAVNKDDLERYIELSDHRYVGFCLDTAQTYIMGHDPVKIYDQYHEIVKYFHLKDTRYPYTPDSARFADQAEFDDEAKRWFWELGSGVVDFPSLWKLIKKYKYKGWMTIEADGTPDQLASLLLSKWYLDHELLPIYK